jgi:hypothetical protein
VEWKIWLTDVALQWWVEGRRGIEGGLVWCGVIGSTYPCAYAGTTGWVYRPCVLCILHMVSCIDTFGHSSYYLSLYIILISFQRMCVRACLAELTKGEVRALHLDTTDGSKGKRGFRLANRTHSTGRQESAPSERVEQYG